MQLELITKKRLANLSKREVYNLIIDRVLANRVLLIEQDFDPEDRLELMAIGLEKAQTETSVGLNMVRIAIERQVNGVFRNKQEEVQFNLFTPGTSVVDQLEDGHYAVTSYEGDESISFNM